MAINLEVPSWLVPPSQAERERLALMEEQVKAKASSMLRKQVGLAKMKQQAEELKGTGMDELTARKTALLNNADLIFAEEPEALSKLVQSEEAQAIKARAQFQLDQYRDRMADVSEDRALELMRHNMEVERLRNEKQITDEQAKGAQDRLKLRDLENDILKTQADITYRNTQTELTRDQRNIAREGLDIKRKEMVESDKELQRLRMRFRSADEELKKKQASGRSRLRFESKKDFDMAVEALKQVRDDIEKQIEARKKELGDSAAPAAREEAPAEDIKDPLGIRGLLK